MASNHFGGQRSSLKFIALIFIGVAAILYFYVQKNFREEEVSSVDQDVRLNSNKEADHLVTEYMQETNKKMEAQKKLGEISVSFRVPKVGQMIPLKPEPKKPLEIEIPEDGAGAGNQRYVPPDISTEDSTPRAIVEHQLNDRQRIEAYDREYRQQYIQAFIENARQNGWNIKVDKNGVVTQASPVPGFDPDNKNPPPNIFIPSARGE